MSALKGGVAGGLGSGVVQNGAELRELVARALVRTKHSSDSAVLAHTNEGNLQSAKGHRSLARRGARARAHHSTTRINNEGK